MENGKLLLPFPPLSSSSSSSNENFVHPFLAQSVIPTFDRQNSLGSVTSVISGRTVEGVSFVVVTASSYFFFRSLVQQVFSDELT